MNAEQLRSTAEKVVSKVILAADESTNSIKKNLGKVGVESNPETNRSYRELLFSTPGIEQYVSGVILFDETFHQLAHNGTPFPRLLQDKGIMPGIKVDRGTVLLPGQGPDTFTQGLDGLDERLAEYSEMGAHFAKWRAVITISNENGSHPSRAAIEVNANALAVYAALCQKNGVVPIVEPEVLMTGAHSLEDCKRITSSVLSNVFGRLEDNGVLPIGMILKPNMVTSGSDADVQANTLAVAESTLEVLRSTVPFVPGIAFLSGGQSPDLATKHLNEINKIKNREKDKYKYPWRITASYGRALQKEALETWKGDAKNVEAAQKAFLARAKTVYAASKGQL